MFDCADDVLWVTFNLFLPPNMAGGADVKEVKSGFIWLQHFLPILLCKWANLQIVQICVCDMAGEIKSLPQTCVYQADWMKSWLILHCDKEEILPVFPVVVAHLLLPNINPSAQIQACLSFILFLAQMYYRKFIFVLGSMTKGVSVPTVKKVRK